MTFASGSGSAPSTSRNSFRQPRVAAVQFRPLTSAPGWLVATKRSKFSRLSSCQRTGALQCPKPQSKSSEAREPYPESYPRAIPRTIPAIHTPYTNLPARPRQKNTYAYVAVECAALTRRVVERAFPSTIFEEDLTQVCEQHVIGLARKF